MLEQRKNILVGIDGSYNSNRAFNQAVQMAKDSHANLYVTRVVEDYSIVEEDGILQLVNYSDDPEVTAAKDDLNQKFMMTRYPIKDTFLRIGNPKKIIAKYLVPGLKIDLLVLGLTGMGAKNAGSTVNFLKNHVNCQVSIIE